MKSIWSTVLDVMVRNTVTALIGCGVALVMGVLGYIGTLQKTIADQREEINEIKIFHTGGYVGSLKEEITTLNQKIATLKQKIATLNQKIADQEEEIDECKLKVPSQPAGNLRLPNQDVEKRIRSLEEDLHRAEIQINYYKSNCVQKTVR